MASDELDKALKLREKGDYKAATKALGKIIDAEGEDEAKAWLYLAETWCDRKDPETAVASYREALKLDLGDDREKAQLGLARALHHAGHHDEALEALDDVEDDDGETAEVVDDLRGRIRRARWVQRYDPLHLVLCLVGLLCVAGTFLPWASVTYEDVFSGDKSAGQFDDWQVTVRSAVLMCLCAGVVLVHVLRLRVRKISELWLSVIDVAFAVCGLVGGVLGFLVLRDVRDAPPFAFERPYNEIAGVQPHVGFYVACGVVVLHAIVAVVALLRAYRR